MKCVLIFLIAVSSACALSLREKALLESIMDKIDIDEKVSKVEDKKTLEAKPKMKTNRERELTMRLMQEQDKVQLLEQQKKEDLREMLQARSVYQMSYMVSYCMGNPNTGYIDYGCYCGYGGGGSPVDAVDECCKIHDECYGKVAAIPCTWFYSPYTISYTYACDNEAHMITCDDNVDLWPCYRKSCDCDKVVAECFTRTLNDYDQNHVGYDATQCTKK